MDIKLTKDQYETAIRKNINNKFILKELVENENFEELREELRNDNTLRSGQSLETIKQRLINASLNTGQLEIFNLMCQLFKITESLPDYKALIDLIYRPGRYDYDFLNTKTDVNYLTDIDMNLAHFEETITDMWTVYMAGNELVNGKEPKYLDKLYSCFGKELNQEEIEQIKNFAKDYYKFKENVFGDIIDEIKEYEIKPESKGDCWGMLMSYLQRDPSKWEIDILWDHMGPYN